MIVSNEDANSEIKKKDHSHGPVLTDDEKGEIFCGSCGLVLVEKTEDSADQRIFSPEEYNSKPRTGPASTLSRHDKGLSTIIGLANKDASGNSISSYMKYTFDRLRIWDYRSKTNHTERNLKSAFAILETVRSKLEISDAVIERAAYIYRKALNKNISRGRTISSLVLSSLYLACREYNVPRSLQDVALAGNITLKDLSRNYRLLATELEMQIQPFNPTEFVSRIGTTLGFSEKAKRDSLDILNQASQKGITEGKNPISLAAAALFISGILNKQKATQNEIARASGVSSVTIRNVSKVLSKSLGKTRLFS